IWLAATALLALAPALRHDPRLGERAAALAASFAHEHRAPSPHEEAPGAAQEADLRPSEGAWSACGGLLFLVPVLDRLAMAAFLEAHPRMAEASFPLHVLRPLAARLGADPGDPLLVALGEPSELLADVPFSLPEALDRVGGPAPRALAARANAGGAAVAAFCT